MENKTDKQLISKEQRGEEAMETPQPRQERPPSYPSSNPPDYSSGPPQPQYAPKYAPQYGLQPQGVYAPQPVQQGHIVQNIPVQQQGCCSGRSKRFKHSVGFTTGVIQLVLAITASILSGVAIYLRVRSDMYNSLMGAPIGGTVLLFLPAGILGICSKKKSNYVIVAYLVMSILAAIQAACVCILEIILSIASLDHYYYGCHDYADYDVLYPEDSLYPSEDKKYVAICCFPTLAKYRYKCLTALHSIIAILMFIELIVAIVASAICCGGLSCCCPRGSPQTNNQTMMYSPMTGVHPLHAQKGTHVVQVPAGPRPKPRPRPDHPRTWTRPRPAHPRRPDQGRIHYTAG